MWAIDVDQGRDALVSVLDLGNGRCTTIVLVSLYLVAVLCSIFSTGLLRYGCRARLIGLRASTILYVGRT